MHQHRIMYMGIARTKHKTLHTAIDISTRTTMKQNMYMCKDTQLMCKKYGHIDQYRNTAILLNTYIPMHYIHINVYVNMYIHKT